jgi:PIN domain nuclease of toxin-antitoxin system
VGATAGARLVGAADVVFVSAASAWEAAIKIALGRLKIPESVEAGVLAGGFERGLAFHAPWP